MELYFLNSDFERIHILDSFKSLIWTDRFWKCGDLDVTCSPRQEILNILDQTSYFQIKESPHIMILETVNIKTDIEKGDLLVFQGRSLESLLERRVIWEPTVLTGSFQDGIFLLLDDNIISPTDTDREMPMDYLTNSNLGSYTVDSQFDGKYTVYKAICELCESKGLGFRIYYNPTTSLFEFKILNGIDRSYSQTANSPVAFTTELNNLVNADYVQSSVNEKNVCLVGGEAGVGNVKTFVEVGSGTGLSRRETYIEPNISRNTPDGEMTEANYLLALEGKGSEELAKKIYLEAFDGEVDTTMYNYGDEFEMGDILQIADNYNHSTKSRVIEMVYSQNSDSKTVYPKFKTEE